MNQTIDSFFPNGKIKLPSSKSYSHRALISAFIANKGAEIKKLNLCEDVLVTLNILKQIGADFVLKGNDVTFFISPIKKIDYVELDVKSSASSLRFLLPLVCNRISHVKFFGSEELFARPLSVYEEVLVKQNIRFIKTNNSIEIFSSLKADDLVLKGDISSQFVTGWLFLLAENNSNHFIKILPPVESEDYILMTLDILKRFGVKFIQNDDLIVNAFSHFNYLSYEVEQDFSQMAYFAVLGALKGQVTFSSLNLKSLQGDKRIIDILMDMSSKIDFIDDEITFMHSLIKGTEIDLKNNIDLGPILFVLGAFSYGTTIIKNVERLKYKESNRLMNMILELKKADVDIAYYDNKVIIKGKSMYQGDYVFDSHNDHRIAMALSIFGVINQGKTVINHSECVNKSYCDFYQDLFSLKKEA